MRPGFGSLVQSLLPKDTLLGAYLKPLKFVADKECSNVMPKFFLHLVGTHKYSLQTIHRADPTSNSEAHRIGGNLKR